MSDRARAVSWLSAGLLGRCPKCGRGSLFSGFLTIRQSCEVCGQDFGAADTGDGPSFFATLIGGFVVLGVGVWAQVAYDPSPLVYAAIFLVGAIFTVALIRPLKSLLTALQFANGAGQGRLVP
jgi:Uncharacterized protein conserved in bacteria